jgi:SAM-dependent methyltransferase
MNKEEYSKMYKLEDSHFWFVAKRCFIDTFLKPVSKEINTILDLGCGTGGMTKHMAKYGKVMFAVEHARRRKLKIAHASAEKLSKNVGKFDLITIFDVLYHKNISSPENVINSCSKLLNRGGYILITDSAFKFLAGSHDIALGGSRRFTIPEIETMLKKSKFKIIRSSYMYFFISPLILIKRLLLDKLHLTKGSDVKAVSPIFNYLLKILLRIEAFSLRWISFPFGSSLIVLAKK